MDENKNDNDGKAESTHEPDEKRDTMTVSHSNSTIDFLVNRARKSAHYLRKRTKPLPKQKKKKRPTGRVQKRRTRKLRPNPRPRYKEGKRRPNPKPILWKLKKVKGKKEIDSCKKTASASCQMGPPSFGISKLCVGCSPMIQNPGYADDYKEISPEMIYRALYDLAMWRHAISTELIFNFIRKRYPINPNTNEAIEELLAKLHVAQLAGIAWALPNDCWRLTTALERVHRLDFTHVTLFWKTYFNTMKPLDRNRQNCVVQKHKVVTTEEEDPYEIV